MKLRYCTRVETNFPVVTPLPLAHEAPPFADYARKVSTKSGEDQGI
jgi:hypothetical protein